jgi:hypothetical protein
MNHASTPNPGQRSDLERLRVDHAILKRLGHWTDARGVHLHARRSSVVLDLRSPQLPTDLEIAVRLDHATLTLLVPDLADIDADELSWTGKGRVHDEGGQPGHERVRLNGAAHDSQIRVRRAGFAQVTAMLSREYLRDVRASRRAGQYPTVDDPRRNPQSDQQLGEGLLD